MATLGQEVPTVGLAQETAGTEVTRRARILRGLQLVESIDHKIISAPAQEKPRKHIYLAGLQVQS